MNNSRFKFSEKLDNEFLDSIYEDDLEHAEIVFEQYITQAPLQMRAIEDAYNRENIGDFRQMMHKLKPVFSYVGLTHLTKMAETIEKRCLEINDVNEVEQSYNEFKNKVKSYETEIISQLAIIKLQIQ
jgi:HPt (histidine-containing phosphotransfer) domain-containing protein